MRHASPWFLLWRLGPRHLLLGQLYLGKSDPRQPLASPVFGDYRGMPPLLIQAGEHEMLRDDSIRVARKARADGASVQLEIWPGMFHVFQSHEPLLPEARAAIDHITDFMRAAGTPAKKPPAAAGGLAPTHVAVKYGPHARNVMDVWLARSDRPTPMLVNIHGGAFQNGTKTVGQGLLGLCLKEQISVAAITYRLSSDAIAPAAFHDAARAIQFLRHQARDWNLDPTRIAATGDSAGAGISLWLGLHDDLADPKTDIMLGLALYRGAARPPATYKTTVIRDVEAAPSDALYTNVTVPWKPGAGR
jgi:acetyl esterase/lipase